MEWSEFAEYVGIGIAAVLLIAWIVAVVIVLRDVHRDPELGPWARIFWFFWVLLLPLAGCLVYFVFRGPGMAARNRVLKAYDPKREERVDLRPPTGPVPVSQAVPSPTAVPPEPDRAA